MLTQVNLLPLGFCCCYQELIRWIKTLPDLSTTCCCCCCRQYARDVAAIQPRWLPELAPAFFASKPAATSGAVGREVAGTAK